MGATARDVLREKGAAAAELGLLDPAVSDEIILSAMVVHPIMVNRPNVATPKGVRLSSFRGGAGAAGAVARALARIASRWSLSNRPALRSGT